MNNKTGRKRFKSYIIYYWLLWIVLLLLVIGHEHFPVAFISALDRKMSSGIFLFPCMIIMFVEQYRTRSFLSFDPRKKYKRDRFPVLNNQGRDSFRFIRYLFSDQDETNQESPIYQAKTNYKNLFGLMAAFLTSAILAPFFFS